MEKIIISCPYCDEKVSVPEGKHIKFICSGCNENLEFNDKDVDNQESDENAKSVKKSSFGDSIITVLSHLVTIPLFIVLHKLVPNPDWIFNLDRMLLLFATLFFVEFILRTIKKITVWGSIISLLLLIYGSFFGSYGFVSLVNDYKEMVFSMINSPHPEEIIISALKPFRDKSVIKEAIDFNNPEVRNFAVMATTKHFNKHKNNGDYLTLIQCFAVFKEINNNWNYVSDPKNQEYYAKASESVNHLSGDCDDHSILMAACIKAIGGTPRLVHTTGHLYPEILIGDRDDIDAINYLISRDLFKSEIRGNKLNYHIDEYNQVWLNLDYTAKYPGGPFMKEEILGTLTLD